MNIIEYAKQQDKLICVLTNSSLQANELEKELQFFAPEYPILQIPSWETLAYDSLSPHQDIVSARLYTLQRLPKQTQAIVIITLDAAMLRLPPTSFVAQNMLLLDIGQNIEVEVFCRDLQEAGYNRVSTVYEHGEYAVRGSIVDLFPMGGRRPFRIDLFDKEVESIRTFDPSTQRSIKQVKKISILPAKEFPTDSQAISCFRDNWHKLMPSGSHQCQIYEDVSNSNFPAGIEYYLPLFFTETASIFDYLPEGSTIITLNSWFNKLEEHRHEIKQRFTSLNKLKPLLDPQHLYLYPEQISSQLKKYPRINIDSTNINSSLDSQVRTIPDLLLDTDESKKFDKLQSFLTTNSDTRILFCADSAGRQEVILNLLKSIQLKPSPCESWQDFLNSNTQYCITTYSLQAGVWLTSAKIALISENDLVGAITYQHRKARAKDKTQLFIRNLAEINIGDPIVHVEKGIGRYQGLTKLNLAGNQTECIAISYADNDKLYVPVTALDVLSRYAGLDPDNAPLHKLGKKGWSKEKSKAMKKIADVAAKLLAEHAKRALATGYKFTIPDNYNKFANDFAFVTTDDQQNAIDDLLADLASNKVTERLICGDVGFGKTEVAMRAVFIAANNSKQSLILVPTTLLAQQHYRNFADRFADWPINIGILSRFISEKEQKQTIAAWEAGKIDVLVGTHRLLSKDLKAHDLGLLVVDEEHRFGVAQKDKIKAKYSHIDSIFMTATPIPRTLNMALCNLRDLSIIATPPVKRLAIKTFIHEYEADLIKEAIAREIGRGGQVYFVHNEVQTIEKTYLELSKLLPDIRMVFAHGQMPERQLEIIMRDFYHHKYQLLIATTIIESGIDIPNANTIIINHADKFGLAQLHQMRGRVGRSHHQAYAYLLTPPTESLTDDAKQRFAAIEAARHLGAGFNLASQDLEIRGAGELLGDQQSGQMNQIGFTLYMELLERTVAALKEGKELDLDAENDSHINIDLSCNALLPPEYIADTHTRVLFYSRINSAASDNALDDLMSELIDRFGVLPQTAKNLFTIRNLGLQAQQIGIKNIKATDTQIKLDFTDKPNIEPTKLITLVQQQPEKYKLLQNGLIVQEKMPEINMRADAVTSLLHCIC